MHPVHDKPDLFTIAQDAFGAQLGGTPGIDCAPAPQVRSQTVRDLCWRTALLGARFMKGATLQGYSLLRTYANTAFNLIFSAVARRRFCDLGSGLNLFRRAIFDDGFHLKFADNLTFNYFLIFGLADTGKRFAFFPINFNPSQ